MPDSLCERNSRGEPIPHRSILHALWRFTLKNCKGSLPDQFGDARAFARKHHLAHERIFIALHCASWKYSPRSLERSLDNLQEFYDCRRLPHEAIRMYETQAAPKTVAA